MTGTYTLSDKLREYAERAVNLDELRPLMISAANEIDRLNAANEELIRGMTEMAERFTSAMDKASPGGGMVMVPLNPTQKMIEAYCNTQERLGIVAWANASVIWPAMLAASHQERGRV